jgi:gas vesicle protein
MSENNSGSMMVGMLVGAAIGAGLALLFAPTAGNETRRAIGQAARKLKDGSQSRLSDVIGTIKESAGDVGAAIDAGREAYRKNAEKTPSGAEHA